MTLEVTGLSSGYGPIRVLHDVSLYVNEGEIVAILGANGAGKSTLMSTLVGLVRPTSGVITLGGKTIAGRSVEDIVRAGLTLVPEGRMIFPRLTVDENLRMGGYSRSDRRTLANDIRDLLERFPRLAERRKQAADTLSGGEQQQLAICRALLSKPRLLLLDEPSLGLAPVMARAVFDLIAELRDHDGLTVVLVEQSVSSALEVADRAYVMQSGAFVASGTTDEISGLAHELEKSYLGEG